MLTEVETLRTETLAGRLQDLEAEVESLKAQIKAQKAENLVSIICFSGEWDRLYATLSIAAGALAMDLEVHLFFTFWALSAMRRFGQVDNHGKSFLQSMFGRLLPSGPGNAPLSRLNFAGLGRVLMKRVMSQKGVEDIDTLYEEVKDLGAHFHLCDTTAELFGLQCHELNVGSRVDQCGVATFLSYALKSKTVLFI